MASRPSSPTRIKALAPRGVFSFIGRSVCSNDGIRSPPYCIPQLTDESVCPTLWAGAFACQPSVIHELAPVADRDVYRCQLLPFRQTTQDLARNFRQQRIGQDVVHVARATLHLRAALRHLFDERFVVRQRDAVRLLNTALNLA